VIQCFTCGALVAMSTLRQHQEIHLENPPAAKVAIGIFSFAKEAFFLAYW